MHTVEQIDSYPADITTHTEDDNYRSEGRSDSPANFYVPKPTLVRNVSSDAMSFATFLIPDSTQALPQTPIRILDKRSNGVASKVRICNASLTGATGHIYLLKSKDDFSISLDPAGTPYCPYGYFLDDAVGGAGSHPYIDIVTSQDLYAVCVNTSVGLGGLVSVASEIYYAD